VYERRKARGTEQRRKFTLTANQSGFSSCYASRREHFNRSRESLRGPPILIRISIFNSSEVAKISAGRKCFTRRGTDIRDIDRRRLLPAVSLAFSLSLSLFLSSPFLLCFSEDARDFVSPKYSIRKTSRGTCRSERRETVFKRFLNRLNLRGAISAGTFLKEIYERNPAKSLSSIPPSARGLPPSPYSPRRGR